MSVYLINLLTVELAGPQDYICSGILGENVDSNNPAIYHILQHLGEAEPSR